MREEGRGEGAGGRGEGGKEEGKREKVGGGGLINDVESPDTFCGTCHTISVCHSNNLQLHSRPVRGECHPQLTKERGRERERVNSLYLFLETTPTCPSPSLEKLDYPKPVPKLDPEVNGKISAVEVKVQSLCLIKILQIGGHFGFLLQF